MERCPICRATYSGEANCRRCRAELSTLLKIEQEAASLTRQAAMLWAAGEIKQAGQLAEKSLALQGSELARVIRSLARNDSLQT